MLPEGATAATEAYGDSTYGNSPSLPPRRKLLGMSDVNKSHQTPGGQSNLMQKSVYLPSDMGSDAAAPHTSARLGGHKTPLRALKNV